MGHLIMYDNFLFKRVWLTIVLLRQTSVISDGDHLVIDRPEMVTYNSS